MSQPGAAFTCITCRVQFNDADLQRAHYKTDWHRYNLKRKVADMPPVTAENFLQRVLSQRAQASEAEKDASVHCTLCNKHFSTSNQYQNHVQSRKHKDAEARDQRKEQAKVDEMNQKNKSQSDDTSETNNKAESKHAENEAIKARLGQGSSQALASSSGTSVRGGSAASTSAASTLRSEGAHASTGTSGADDVEMESDGESCEEWDGDALGLEECLFCPKVSASLENNVEHMTRAHSFFIPDLDFISDFEGLMSYLGEKVGEGHICLWCNERSKTFLSTLAVQRHMVDKGHCKLKFEGDAVYEYSDYYDYRSSYPDYVPSADRARDSGDEEDEEEVSDSLLEENEYQLVLPSGATIGHRTLQRYYRQNLRPERGARTSALTRALAQYKSLGWTGITSVDARKRAKDIEHMQRMKKVQRMRLGVKANKFQPHFRPQVVF